MARVEVLEDLIVLARDGHLGLIGIRERADGIGQLKSTRLVRVP
jgi:hypothetical protein